MKYKQVLHKNLKEHINPFQHDKKVWVRLHLDSNFWEELEVNFPEEVWKFDLRGSEMSNILLRFLATLEENEANLPRKGKFPLTLNFSIETNKTLVIDKINWKDDNTIIYPYLYEFIGYCESLESLKKLLKAYIDRDGQPFNANLLPADRPKVEQFKSDDQDNTKIYISGTTWFSASPMVTGVCQVKCVSFFRYHKRRCVTSDCWL